MPMFLFEGLRSLMRLSICFVFFVLSFDPLRTVQLKLLPDEHNAGDRSNPFHFPLVIARFTAVEGWRFVMALISNVSSQVCSTTDFNRLFLPLSTVSVGGEALFLPFSVPL
jgi:hypothetical protein